MAPGKPVATPSPPEPTGVEVAMIDAVYNKRILALAADIPRLHRLDAPDATAVAHSRLCGSKVTVDIKMAGDRVTDFGHEVKACALGQASSSIIARHVVGSSARELIELPVRDFKARHASTLLTFDAVRDAVEQVMARQKIPA
jgi:NifU-like protein involved in Fe-S cluster formation